MFPFESQSHAKTRASAMSTHSYVYQRRPSTNSDKLSELSYEVHPYLAVFLETRVPVRPTGRTSMPAQLASAHGVRAGRDDLVCGARSDCCGPGQKGGMRHVFGPFRAATIPHKLSDDVKHLGRLTLGHPVGCEFAIACKLLRPFEALPALLASRIAPLRVLEYYSHRYLLVRSFACVCVRAKDGEAAFWFQPSVGASL